MREVEEWLWETGWGVEIPDIEVTETQGMEGDEGQYQQEEELDSEAGDNSDEQDSELGEGVDGDELGEDDEIIEDEETMEGNFGYSTFWQNVPNTLKA